MNEHINTIIWALVFMCIGALLATLYYRHNAITKQDLKVLEQTVNEHIEAQFEMGVALGVKYGLEQIRDHIAGKRLRIDYEAITDKAKAHRNEVIARQQEDGKK